ncbi:MAG: preprotein translocase subunit SecG [Lysobacterales bacterium]|nr:MAG: preprotein translocase subunit SecG [Xanthomonadales bacterium]
MATYLNIALVIVSFALIAVILLQSREAGLGGLGGGADMGGAGFHVRRGIERLLYNITIILSAMFFILALVTVTLVG